MAYFTHSNGQLYFLSADDIANGGELLLPSGCTAITDEAADQIQSATNTPTAQAAIKAQIVALEDTVTPRRMREAALGLDGGWLLAINAQIAALRAQLF